VTKNDQQQGPFKLAAVYQGLADVAGCGGCPIIGALRPLGMDFLNELRWRPEIGDPSFMGWFTVVAYGIVALLAARVRLKGKDRIWLAVTLGMAALCVNKQLDLQSLFTHIGRVASHHLGWYEQRRVAEPGPRVTLYGERHANWHCRRE
jgi:hypothetical protein